MRSRLVILFVAVLILGALLRFYRLVQIPASLNPDEVSLGYNAFSLLKTGADEHGVRFPLTLQSFGDWKMPIYSVVTMLPVAVLGLTEMAVRLPSALSGIVGIIIMALLAERLFKSKKAALLAMFFYALSPWNIYFSRVAYEVNLGVTFFLASTYFFLGFISEKDWRKLVIAALLLSLTVFTYHAFLIFTPLFSVGALIFYWEDLGKKKAIVAGMVLMIFVAVSLGNSLMTNGSKLGDLAVWNNRDIIYGRVERFRTDGGGGRFLGLLLHNKFLGIPYQIAENYVASFSPGFLFDRGGQKELHNLGYFGNLYLIEALFLALGFAFMFWNRVKNLKLLLIWLLVSPVASSITTDHPSSTRLYMLMPLFVLVEAFGVWQLVKVFRLRLVKMLGVMVCVILLGINVLLWEDGYLVHLNILRAQYLGYGFREAALLAKRYPNYRIIWARAEQFPYIYVLFYNQIDPREFQKGVVYFPTTPEGFRLVKSFGRFSFPPNQDETTVGPVGFKKGVVYIEKFGIHSNSHPINLPSGEARFWYYVSD